MHTKGVAARAAEVGVTVPSTEREVLVAAAWLHDIGYSPSLRRTGFDPLDGGIRLRSIGWPDRVCALVAHHSGARFVPVERGFADLMAKFDFEDSPVSDALTYADQTVGPHGRPMTVELTRLIRGPPSNWLYKRFSADLRSQRSPRTERVAQRRLQKWRTDQDLGTHP